MPKTPDECTTMLDVRAGVDATDRELVALLDRRFGYMRAAARIKPSRDTVRDEERSLRLSRRPRLMLRRAAFPAM